MCNINNNDEDVDNDEEKDSTVKCNGWIMNKEHLLLINKTSIIIAFINAVYCICKLQVCNFCIGSIIGMYHRTESVGRILAGTTLLLARGGEGGVKGNVM